MPDDGDDGRTLLVTLLEYLSDTGSLPKLDDLDDETDDEAALRALLDGVDVSGVDVVTAVKEADGSLLATLVRTLPGVEATTSRDVAEARLNGYDLRNEPPDYHGILTNDRIADLANPESAPESKRLIDPFDENRLRPAAYELRMGDEYYKESTHHTLDENDRVEIPPFGAVVVKSKELINMPRYLVGRLNIKVNWAHQGLLWIGGPMVDPGYVGHLYCPIFNLSDSEIGIGRNDAFGTIDFMTTTDPTEDTEHYYGKGDDRVVDQTEHNVVFKDFEGTDLKSTAIPQEAIQEMEAEIDRMSNVLFVSLGAIFTVLAVIVTALSIFVTGQSQVGAAVAPWVFPATAVSSIGIVILLTVGTGLLSRWSKSRTE